MTRGKHKQIQGYKKKGCIIMQGEIGMKIDKIILTEFADFEGNITHDMTITDKEGQHFHIVGDNNLKELLEDALANIVVWEKEWKQNNCMCLLDE